METIKAMSMNIMCVDVSNGKHLISSGEMYAGLIIVGLENHSKILSAIREAKGRYLHSNTFCCVWSNRASNSAVLREQCFEMGAK